MKQFITTLIIFLNLTFSSLGQISLVKDINQVPSGSMPITALIRSFESINNKTIFLVQNNRPEFNLISIDSTNHTTTTLLKLNYSNQGNVKFVKFNGFIYFFVNQVNSNRELWRTNGTAAGTVKVKDNFGYTSEIIVLGGQMYFLDMFSIWESDGTTQGTISLSNINNIFIDNSGVNLVGFNNNIIFRTTGNNTYLSKIDLQSLVVTPIAENSWNIGSSIPTISSYIDADTALYLINKRYESAYLLKIKSNNFQTTIIDTLNNYAKDLYKINNHIIFTTNNKLLSISPNSAIQKSIVLRDTLSLLPYYNRFSSFSTILNNKFYFIASGLHSGYKLWKTDGTVKGTIVVKDLPTLPTVIFTLDNHLYFKLYGQNKLWKSDGTAQNTIISVDLPVAKLDSLVGFEKQFWVSNHKAFFWGDTPQYGAEPYFTDGNTTAELVKDVNLGNNSSHPLSTSLKINGVLYFIPYNGIRYNELWKTDGTAEGTVLIKEIPQFITSSIYTYISNMTEMNGILYFITNDGYIKNQLWRSDGTTEGTYMVKDINFSYVVSSTPSNIAVLNGFLYFSAYDGTSNSDIWKSDGTTVGTIKFKQSASNIFATKNRLYFSSFGKRGQQVVWTSDGTIDETHPLRDLDFNITGLRVFNPICFTNIDDKVYFFSSYQTSTYSFINEALFVSDGTENGTQIVKSFGRTQGADSLGLTTSNSLFLTAANKQLFFHVRSLKVGSLSSIEYYLWKSDGTLAGTTLVSPDTKSILGYYKIASTSTNIYYVFGKGYDSEPSELWTITGNSNLKLKDFPFLFRNSYNLVLFDDKLYMNYNPSDSTNSSILKIENNDVQTYWSSNQITLKLLEMDGNFYFESYQDATGYELWKLATCNYTTSKQSGDWDSPNTWLCNNIPTLNDTVLIKPNHTINVNNGIKRLQKLILRGNINMLLNSYLQYH